MAQAPLLASTTSRRRVITAGRRSTAGWSWDFVADLTDNGGRLRILCLIDEYSRECLALHVARKLTAHDLTEVMDRLECERGVPEHIRSDNGSEFIARILQQWLAQRGVKTLYIEPGMSKGNLRYFTTCQGVTLPKRAFMLDQPEKVSVPCVITRSTGGLQQNIIKD